MSEMNLAMQDCAGTVRRQPGRQAQPVKPGPVVLGCVLRNNYFFFLPDLFFFFLAATDFHLRSVLVSNTVAKNV
ncbi:MAG: hypothetical protein DME23_13705 [Verrucomicrobia bacterium]|nr:MAG: hypothetical protein DME23_13705 [Verrucomicrobiota bacterium]